jgi:hypothetical protein
VSATLKRKIRIPIDGLGSLLRLAVFRFVWAILLPFLLCSLGFSLGSAWLWELIIRHMGCICFGFILVCHWITMHLMLTYTPVLPGSIYQS